MNCGETEFLAEKEIVQVVPNFNHGIIYLISGDIGPFRAGIPTNVPLWLAINLRQRQRCKMVQPDWMSVEVLEQVKNDEKDNDLFTDMPNKFYMEVSQLFFESGLTEISNADQIRTLLKDIWDIRIAKLRRSVVAFINSGEKYAKLNNLTLMELNTVRPLLQGAADNLFKLRSNVATTRINANNSTTIRDNSMLSSSLFNTST